MGEEKEKVPRKAFMTWWQILGLIVWLTSLQIILGLLLIALVHDMVVNAYRQLWREVMAAAVLDQKELQDTPPAKEASH